MKGGGVPLGPSHLSQGWLRAQSRGLGAAMFCHLSVLRTLVLTWSQST